MKKNIIKMTFIVFVFLSVFLTLPPKIGAAGSPVQINGTWETATIGGQPIGVCHCPAEIIVVSCVCVIIQE